MVKFFGALLLLFAAHNSFASSPLAAQLNASSDFQPVLSAFGAGKYDEALQQLQQHPHDDPIYYYNLGTVFLKLKRIGPATAYLEKANRLQPHDISIQQNLQLSRNALSQKIGADKLDPASSWIESVSDNLHLEEIRGAFGLIAFIIALFWIRSYLKTRSLRETLAKPAGLLGIGALCITAGLYGLERVSGANPVAVCLEHTLIRSGPGDSYLEVAQVEGGSKLRALGPTSEGVSAPAAPTAAPAASPQASPVAESSPAPSAAPVASAPDATPQLWRQIRYSADGIGWVRASSVLLL